MIKYYCDACRKEVGSVKGGYEDARELEILKKTKEGEEDVFYNVVEFLCADCQEVIFKAQQEAIKKNPPLYLNKN